MTFSHLIGQIRWFSAALFSTACLCLVPGTAPASALADGPATGRACAISGARAVALPSVVQVPDAYTGNTPDPVTTAMKAWAEHFMRLSSKAHASDRARKAMMAEMVAVAERNALAWPKGWDRGEHRPPSVIYHTMETVFPYAVAYAQFRDEFPSDQQRLIDKWLGDIVDRLGRAKKIKQWKLDNKKYQYGALAAAYGVATARSKYLKKAVAIYRTAIKGQRRDGSLPGDSGRGGNALHYTNLALANLVAIAEFAAAYGTDLYRYSSGGKSIHTAVAFLAAAQNNPALIAGYAAKQSGASFSAYSPTNQDRRWAGKAAASWGYYYLARFRDTASGQALLAASPFLRAGRAGVHQQSGGNARCYVGG